MIIYVDFKTKNPKLTRKWTSQLHLKQLEPLNMLLTSNNQAWNNYFMHNKQIGDYYYPANYQINSRPNIQEEVSIQKNKSWNIILKYCNKALYFKVIVFTISSTVKINNKRYYLFRTTHKIKRIHHFHWQKNSLNEGNRK